MKQNSSKVRVAWLFGLPCSGKTTLSRELLEKGEELGHTVVILDGDDVRKGINSDLDFSMQGRHENIRRAAEFASLLVRQGVFVICAFVTPMATYRTLIRQILGNQVLFVYLNCSEQGRLDRSSQRSTNSVLALRLSKGNSELGFEAPGEADFIINTDLEREGFMDILSNAVFNSPM